MFIAVILFSLLAGVQARYIGLRDYGHHDAYYYQPLNYGPSNPFGSSWAGLALNPHYAYSKAAYQDYKYQQVKYTPYRQAPHFDFGQEENKGKHYCPASRPFYIRRKNKCVESCQVFPSWPVPTDYNPRLEDCCNGANQFFNTVTSECEDCPAEAPIFSPNEGCGVVG